MCYGTFEIELLQQQEARVKAHQQSAIHHSQLLPSVMRRDDFRFVYASAAKLFVLLSRSGKARSAPRVQFNYAAGAAISRCG
jgi:hypothetical protein